jgi:hypothetical protein
MDLSGQFKVNQWSPNVYFVFLQAYEAFVRRRIRRR